MGLGIQEIHQNCKLSLDLIPHTENTSHFYCLVGLFRRMWEPERGLRWLVSGPGQSCLAKDISFQRTVSNAAIKIRKVFTTSRSIQWECQPSILFLDRGMFMKILCIVIAALWWSSSVEVTYSMVWKTGLMVCMRSSQWCVDANHTLLKLLSLLLICQTSERWSATQHWMLFGILATLSSVFRYWPCSGRNAYFKQSRRQSRSDHEC